ncbi:preprotein translocase subunit SecG [Rhizobium sp. TRM95796]|uniref:preprotein translocase subunit SecG n=1 Tax=Rhizobium sp. TRM95796 TaxID=2979862 RepID=UPI0021E7D6D1|nr:preprotein translocase subunit SecG [Rhizobium sp. TRM95796]MCV3768613.1 preprotein translocase subunit SecG [Rhizobium sp. TRM95796]
MQTVLIVIHLMIVLALVGVVLIQRSEGGGLGIGGGSGFMSARGAANALTRTTAILAALFFITSLGLGLLARYEAKPTDILNQLPTSTSGSNPNGLLDSLGGNKPEAKPADPNAIPTGGDNTNAATPAQNGAAAPAVTPAQPAATPAQPAATPAEPAATPAQPSGAATAPAAGGQQTPAQ